MSLLSPALPEAASFLPLSVQSVGRGGRADIPAMAQSIPLLHLHTNSLASLHPCPLSPSFPPHFSLYISFFICLPLVLCCLFHLPPFSSQAPALSFLHLLSSSLPSEIAEVKKASWQKTHNKQDRGKRLGRRAGKENILVRPSRTAQFPTTARDAPEHWDEK